MAALVDRRIFFVGDSFVVGVGDPECRGWVGRLAARSWSEGIAATVYNLGVRRNTSADVRARWSGEVAARRAAGCAERMVVSFGVNDTATENGRLRVEPAQSVSNLEAVVAGAADTGLGLLVVGPAPIADARQNERIAALDRSFDGVCAAAGVPYVDVFGALADEPAWMDEVRRTDGSHPGAEGYELLAELVLPSWRRSWAETSGGVRPG